MKKMLKAIQECNFDLSTCQIKLNLTSVSFQKLGKPKNLTILSVALLIQCYSKKNGSNQTIQAHTTYKVVNPTN